MASATLYELPETAYQLGELRREYVVSPLRLASKGLWTAILVALLVGLPARWLLRGELPALRPHLAGGIVAIVGLLLLIGFVIGNVWSFARAFGERGQRVLVFDQGFVSFRQRGIFVCRWEDVLWTKEEFFQVFQLHYPCFTIALRSGEQWVMNNARDLLGGFSHLQKTISEQVVRQCLPQALIDLRARKTLQFGRLRLSYSGITMDGKTLSWSDVGEFHREDMGVTIVKRGSFLPWAQVHVNELRNPALLRNLIREMVPTA